jgi:hypothetical protein
VQAAQGKAAALAVISSPRARVDGVSVIPGQPQRRIAEWYMCRDSTCTQRRNALTVTGNGFADAHVVDLPPHTSTWSLEPAGPDHFAVA